MRKDNLMKLVQLIESDKVIYQILKECPYEILRHIQIREYGKGTFILEQGKIYNTFYIVAKGKVDIFEESENGKKFFYAEYKKGDYIGELELFQQVGYLSRAESKDSVTMLEIPREFFMKWIQIDQNFNEYLIRTLCINYYRLCTNLGRNTLYPLKQRICYYLMEQMDLYGKEKVSLNTDMLSQQMGITQRSVNRIIKQLKEKEIIDLYKTDVLIKDYQALAEEAKQK